jgi:hypothetical protein
MKMKNELRLILYSIIFVIFLTTTSFNLNSTISLAENSQGTMVEILAAPDIYETDNDFASAKNISLNSLQERSISSVDDVDYVMFTLDSFYSIEIETTGTSDDTRLWVFDYNHNQIAFDDDGGIEKFSKLSFDIFKAGHYFIKIDEFGNDDEIDNYNLTLSATLIADPYFDDTPQDCYFIVLNYDYERSLYPVGDVDYFAFTILIEYNVTLEITGTSGDTEMSLFWDPMDEGGSQIDYDDDGGINGFSKIVQTNLPPGVYYIKIWEWGNNNEILNYTLHTTGTSDYDIDSEGPDVNVFAPFPSTFSSSEIILTTSATDASGIDSVQLHYKLNDASWETIDMIHDMFVYYGICIGPLEVGDSFTYYVTAYDNSAANFLTTEDNSSLYYNFIVSSNDNFDPLEKDDSLNYARSIDINSTIDRRIFPVGDVDYCTFNLAEEYDIIIETSGTSGDTVLFLYDENLTLITVNDNSGVDSFSKIILSLDTGNYTIRIVENGDDEMISSYSITLTTITLYDLDCDYFNSLIIKD